MLLGLLAQLALWSHLLEDGVAGWEELIVGVSQGLLLLLVGHFRVLNDVLRDLTGASRLLQLVHVRWWLLLIDHVLRIVARVLGSVVHPLVRLEGRAGSGLDSHCLVFEVNLLAELLRASLQRIRLLTNGWLVVRSAWLLVALGEGLFLLDLLLAGSLAVWRAWFGLSLLLLFLKLAWSVLHGVNSFFSFIDFGKDSVLLGGWWLLPGGGIGVVALNLLFDMVMLVVDVPVELHVGSLDVTLELNPFGANLLQRLHCLFNLLVGTELSSLTVR
jgi:hypothetical protein